MPDNKLCLVLGGSFNPPTLAHAAMARLASEELSKKTGRPAIPVFVPSSRDYVARKMTREPEASREAFPEALRLQLLKAVTKPLAVKISDIEFGDDGRGHTYDTMAKLKARDPGHEYIFLAGSDKLSIMPRWRGINAFLTEFKIAVAARDESPGSVHNKILANPLLEKYKGSFIILSIKSTALDEISSTKAREAYCNEDWEALSRICGEEATGLMRGYYEKPFI